VFSGEVTDMPHIDLTYCEEILVKAILVISAAVLLIRVIIIGIRDIRGEIREHLKNR
jgi:hypothetical protein